MPKRIAGLVLLIAALLPLPALPVRGDDRSISAIISQIEKEIDAAQSADTGYPPLVIDKVDLELNVVTTKKVGAEVTVSVPLLETAGAKVSGSVQQSDSQTIILAFVPAIDVQISSDQTLGLAEAIKSVKKQLQTTMGDGSLLVLKSFLFKASFLVVAEGRAGFRFLILSDSELGAYRKISNTITVSMRVPEYY